MFLLLSAFLFLPFHILNKWKVSFTYWAIRIWNSSTSKNWYRTSIHVQLYLPASFKIWGSVKGRTLTWLFIPFSSIFVYISLTLRYSPSFPILWRMFSCNTKYNAISCHCDLSLDQAVYHTIYSGMVLIFYAFLSVCLYYSPLQIPVLLFCCIFCKSQLQSGRKFSPGLYQGTRQTIYVVAQ